MGWWKIDPSTGMPLNTFSKRSTPGMQLLNAVPGVDDEENACYMGDSPWDFVAMVIPELEKLLKGNQCPSLEQLVALFVDDILPPSFGDLNQKDVRKFQKRLQRYSKSLDLLYDDEWGRPARRAEKLWACHTALEQLANGEYRSTPEE